MLRSRVRSLLWQVVTVVQPCAHNGHIKVSGVQTFGVPAFVENVYELLGSRAGEFFLDAAEGAVYYVPHEGEAPGTTVGHLPMVERLIEADGAAALSFHGILFEHSTWMHPSTRYGFVELQSGWTLTCEVGDACDRGRGVGAGKHLETPAALQFRASRNVSLDECSFERLGSNAISFSHGSHGNRLRRCAFRDISASAVAIGTRDDPTNATLEQEDLDNAVSDCTISHVAIEYRGAPALLVGYSRRTTIEHNEISHVPYTGISLGWGWTRHPHTYDGENTIVGNHIHHHMQLLGDGGAIYTLGAQGNLPFGTDCTRVEDCCSRDPQGKCHSLPAIENTSALLPPSIQQRNWIHDGGTASTARADHEGIGQGCHCPAGLYTDEGSTNWDLSQNVIQTVATWLDGCRAGAVIGPNWQHNNFYDTASARSVNLEVRCPLVGNVQVDGGAWPTAAVMVMKAAGPRKP
jgi:hypothetical protein